MNNSQELVLDERSFFVKCINDYVHFITSFYNLMLSTEQSKEVKDILYIYFVEGKFEHDLFSSPEILKNFFNRNGNKLKEINRLQSLFITNRMQAEVEQPTKKRSSNSSSTNNNDSERSPPERSIFQRRLRGRPALSSIVSYNNNDNLSPVPTTLIDNSYRKFNQLSNFTNIKTSGQQSNMMVSSNGNFFFKTLKSWDLSKRRQFKNECRIYRHLQERKPLFLKNSTCFVECYSDGILLKNGGLSLYHLLKIKKKKSNTFNSKQLNPILQQFFSKVLELQLSGVTHNDLHCDNVVGFDRHDLRFIDFGLAKTCEVVLNMDFLVRLNKVFEEIFFYFARRYQLF
jgi:hypothetical protein